MFAVKNADGEVFYGAGDKPAVFESREQAHAVASYFEEAYGPLFVRKVEFIEKVEQVLVESGFAKAVKAVDEDGWEWGEIEEPGYQFARQSDNDFAKVRFVGQGDKIGMEAGYMLALHAAGFRVEYKPAGFVLVEEKN